LYDLAAVFHLIKNPGYPSEQEGGWEMDYES
jgi:hypothetical protein